MKGLISVIIPNRKGESNESIESVKKQSYGNIEIIKIIDKEGRGASWARNQGAKKAKGEYLFFCDNDLELEVDCLENLFNTLEKNEDCDWAFGRFKIDGIEYNLNKKKFEGNEYSKEFIDYFHDVSTMSLIRAKAKPMFDDEMRRFVDWDLWIRLTRAGHKPAFCDHTLFSTKTQQGRISTGDDSAKWKDHLYKKYLRKIADIVIPHHSQHDMLAGVLKKLDNKIFNIIIVSGGTFAENCNKGAKLAETEDIIFLNDDTDPTNEALIKMVEDKNEITGIGQYIPATRKKKFGIGIDPDTFYRYLADSVEESLMPSGFCFKVKKKTWEKLGGLDEIFRNGAEDIDLFLRAKVAKIGFGYIEDCIPHFLSKSKGRFDFAGKNDIILEKRWRNKKVLHKDIKNCSASRRNEIRALCNFYYRGELIKKNDILNLTKDKMRILQEQKLVA